MEEKQLDNRIRETSCPVLICCLLISRVFVCSIHHLITMGFGDLQSRDGLALLNTFLNDKSYIEGLAFTLSLTLYSIVAFVSRYRPTQGDVVVFEAVKKAPSADLANALRWYNHIASFNDGERKK